MSRALYRHSYLDCPSRTAPQEFTKRKLPHKLFVSWISSTLHFDIHDLYCLIKNCLLLDEGCTTPNQKIQNMTFILLSPQIAISQEEYFPGDGMLIIWLQYFFFVTIYHLFKSSKGSQHSGQSCF